MSGWVPLDASWWPAIAAQMTAPWPQEAALFDLRWHVDRDPERKVPHGKRFWIKRWGWTDWGVRSLLRSGLWHDPIHPLSAQEPPTSRPGTTRGPPAVEPTQADNDAGTTRGPPADRPRTTRGPPKNRHTRVDPPSPSPSPSQEQEQQLRPPEATGSLHRAAEPEPDNDGVPKWARVKGHRRHDVLGAVVRSIEAITQRTINPDRCATDAKHVIALQRATGTPWAELADQIASVAEWARDSGDALAENDIRGLRPDGSAWGTDRSRSVATLTVQAKWADRLRAAEEWATPAPQEPVWRNDLCGPPRMRRASGPA